MSKTIGEVMSTVPITIPDDLSLTDAQQRMFDHKIRHLPVLNGEHLVGLLSERDIALIGGIPSVKLDKVTVGQAMHEKPFTCNPGDSMREVTTTMLEHKFGSAIVMDDGKVVGMYTTVDALRELISVLD